MIDTIEKLEAVVTDPIHKLRIVATAVGAYSDESDDDVWGTYWVDDEEQIDFNIHIRGDDDALTIWAYALKSVPNEEPYVLQVNTAVGAFVAYVEFEGK